MWDFFCNFVVRKGEPLSPWRLAPFVGDNLLLYRSLKMKNNMRKTCWLVALLVVLGTNAMMSQDDEIAMINQSVKAIMAQDDSSAADSVAAEPVPVWKQKLYYGYDFDIYYHNDSRTNRKENGWSFTIEPELGWRLKDNLYMGVRIGGNYQSSYTTYTIANPDGSTSSRDLRIRQGSWEVTPYMRYRLKTMFNEKIGIWLEGHIYTGMQFPRVTDGNVAGTDYEDLRHSVIYGVQIAPVITYQFNRESSFQIFFSILSLGYSGTTFCYDNPDKGKYNEYTNDVVIFSGKLRNLIANQFTPGLYGLKFGVQKSF